MGYFLCLRKCFKKYLFLRGYVVKSDMSGKYLIPLDIRGRPEGEIQTLVNGSSILANNDQYDFKGKLIETDYEGIYKTGTEFFIVHQKGQSAFLKLVSKAEAETIYHQMPRKIVTNEDVFLDPVEVRKRNVRDLLERAEEERPRREFEERVRKIRERPYWWLDPDNRDFDED